MGLAILSADGFKFLGLPAQSARLASQSEEFE
jgi:hypothetical protein